MRKIRLSNDLSTKRSRLFCYFSRYIEKPVCCKHALSKLQKNIFGKFKNMYQFSRYMDFLEKKCSRKLNVLTQRIVLQQVNHFYEFINLMTLMTCFSLLHAIEGAIIVSQPWDSARKMHLSPLHLGPPVERGKQYAFATKLIPCTLNVSRLKNLCYLRFGITYNNPFDEINIFLRALEAKYLIDIFIFYFFHFFRNFIDYLFLAIV